jgi:hypothetical protein
MLLDTCGSVTEAKQALLLTKQYYEAVPVHYLIADRFGNAFVWEYSQAHNREYIIETPDLPLVSTNFSLHKHLKGGMPPTPREAVRVCPRYCRLTERLASTDKLSEEFIQQTHKRADAELPQSADPSRPPIRTMWHALYYPEERRARFSFYLRDEPDPVSPRKIRVVRSDYCEFQLTPTTNAAAPAVTPSESARPSESDVTSPKGSKDTDEQRALAESLKRAGAEISLQDGHVISVVIDQDKDIEKLLPLLPKLPDLEELSIHNSKMNDSRMAVVKGMPKLSLLKLTTSPVGDDGLRVVKTLPRLRSLYLGATKVTDAGLVHLKALPQLENLIFRDTDVTDAGVSCLEGLTNVTGLNLAGTKVTDGCLKHLTGMSRLTKLNVSRTAVTAEGLARVKKSLPVFVMVEKDK